MPPKSSTVPANEKMRITSFFRPVSSPQPSRTTRSHVKPEPTKSPLEPEEHNVLNEALKAPASESSSMVRTRSSFKTPEPPTKRSRGSTPAKEQHVPQITPNSSFTGSQDSTRPRVVPSSDGEESDASDSDGLEDLATMVGVKKPATRRAVTMRSASPSRPAPGPAPKKAYKFDLKALAKEKEKEDEHQKNRKVAKEMMARPERESTPLDKDAVPSAALLGGLMGEAAAKKLMQALERKDAWKVEEVYNFFESAKGRRPKNAFPTQAPEGGSLASMNESFFREQMFLSGFVQDMTLLGEILPDEILVWLSDELCVETREDLSFAYAHVLEMLPPAKLKSFMSSNTITRLFGVLGGRRQSVDLEQQLTVERPGEKEEEEWKHWNTITYVRLLAAIAPDLDLTAISTAYSLLIRLSLDRRVRRKGDLLKEIEKCLLELSNTIPESEWLEQHQRIGAIILKTVTSPEIRPSVLGILPATEPRIHLFRRRLALAFLLNDAAYLSKPYEDLVSLNNLIDLLHSPTYAITSKTNYSALQANMSLLDIAIDSGATARDKAKHDKDVDVLVERLRIIFSKILDTNARDIARTETKDKIERIIFRLNFSVRSKEKAAFGDRGGFSQTRLNFGASSSTAG